MEINRVTPAGKKLGWYDAAGTRYYHQAELAALQKVVDAARMITEEHDSWPNEKCPCCYCALASAVHALDAGKEE